jgi:hypothetical protein
MSSRTAKNWERSRGETKKDSEGLVLHCQVKGLADAMRVWDDDVLQCASSVCSHFDLQISALGTALQQMAQQLERYRSDPRRMGESVPDGWPRLSI